MNVEIPYDRYLENKSRMTTPEGRFRLGNPKHPYYKIYKEEGMEAAFVAMGLLPKNNRLRKIKTTLRNLFDEVVEGQVYIITNPNFPEWVKVGMAVDSEDRLNGYQTSSPFRDYALYKSWPVSDRRSAESDAHSLLEKTFDRRGEWFKCTPEEAESAIAGLMEQHK